MAGLGQIAAADDTPEAGGEEVEVEISRDGGACKAISLTLHRHCTATTDEPRAAIAESEQ